ncbi:unnamed protein product, partial [Ilex paraguariensis]
PRPQQTLLLSMLLLLALELELISMPAPTPTPQPNTPTIGSLYANIDELFGDVGGSLGDKVNEPPPGP